MKIKVVFTAHLALAVIFTPLNFSHHASWSHTSTLFFSSLIPDTNNSHPPHTFFFGVRQTPLSHLAMKRKCESCTVNNSSKWPAGCRSHVKRKMQLYSCSLRALTATQSKRYALSSHYCFLTSINYEWWKQAAGLLPLLKPPHLNGDWRHGRWIILLLLGNISDVETNKMYTSSSFNDSQANWQWTDFCIVWHIGECQPLAVISMEACFCQEKKKIDIKFK